MNELERLLDLIVTQLNTASVFLERAKEDAQEALKEAQKLQKDLEGDLSGNKS